MGCVDSSKAAAPCARVPSRSFPERGRVGPREDALVRVPVLSKAPRGHRRRCVQTGRPGRGCRLGGADAAEIAERNADEQGVWAGDDQEDESPVGPGTQIPHGALLHPTPDGTLPPGIAVVAVAIAPPSGLGSFAFWAYRLLVLPSVRPCALLISIPLGLFRRHRRRLPKRHPRQGRLCPGHPCGGADHRLRQDRNPHEGHLHTDPPRPLSGNDRLRTGTAPPWPKGIQPSHRPLHPRAYPLGGQRSSLRPLVRFPAGARVLSAERSVPRGNTTLLEEWIRSRPSNPRANGSDGPETGCYLGLSDPLGRTRRTPREGSAPEEHGHPDTASLRRRRVRRPDAPREGPGCGTPFLPAAPGEGPPWHPRLAATAQGGGRL